MRMMRKMMKKMKRTIPSHPPLRKTTVKMTTAKRALSRITIRATRSSVITLTLMRLKTTMVISQITHPLSIKTTGLSRTMLKKVTLLCIRPINKATTTIWCLPNSSKSLSLTTTMAKSTKDLESRHISILTEGIDLTSMTRTRSRGWGLQSLSRHLSRPTLPITGPIRTSKWAPTNSSLPQKCTLSTSPTMAVPMWARNKRLLHVNPRKLYLTAIPNRLALLCVDITSTNRASLRRMTSRRSITTWIFSRAV